MSRLFRFLSEPCAKAPAKILIDGMADWLASPERMRHAHETLKEAKQPGKCHLCGDALPEAFLVVFGGQVYQVSAASKNFERIRDAWVDNDNGTYTADDGRVSQVVPMFFCPRACSGPRRESPLIPDLFSLAEVELKRREKEAREREKAAEKAGAPEAKSVRTKSTV